MGQNHIHRSVCRNRFWVDDTVVVVDKRCDESAVGVVESVAWEVCVVRRTAALMVLGLFGN